MHRLQRGTWVRSYCGCLHIEGRRRALGKISPDMWRKTRLARWLGMIDSFVTRFRDGVGVVEECDVCAK